MEAVGYDLYCKMLNEAVKEAKGIAVEESFDTSIDIVIDAYIPMGYIPNELQKLDIYKRIADIGDAGGDGGDDGGTDRPFRRSAEVRGKSALHCKNQINGAPALFLRKWRRRVRVSVLLSMRKHGLMWRRFRNWWLHTVRR